MSERAWVGNAADPKQVKKAKQLDRQRAERERTDLESILSTVGGRRFLWKQLSDAGIFAISLRVGQPDLTAFNEGRRQQGLQLLMEIQALNPDYYHRMAKEAHDLNEQTKPESPDEKPVDIEETES
jgi:hypothetical protein